MTQPVTGAPHATSGPQAGSGAAGDPGFTAVVSAITDAFGDPTRRRIYLFVREHTTHDDQPVGVTASEVAAEVGVHPNVARHHLDKLAAGGYVEVVARSVGDSAGRRAGRPSKHYVAVPGDTAAELPPVRSDDLVLALLGQALARLPQPDAEAMAEEVGATYGQQLAAGLTGDALVAGQRSLRSAMQSVAAALTAHGFAARTGAGDKLRIINDHCPFGSLALDHPVLCAVDRGLVRGMLTALYPSGVTLDVATESSRARGDAICTTAL
ncbi:helix-turn-helix transcriptional regulator [Desertimonas flava]|uniref:helix-turn-helix transcriptional regulator n=1 Tax=Desertimonas flava TaxID=2064846 RepID=UPI000E341629|nr:helix-turn-helix domain-containing protein [Desertimonas flava]